MNIKIVGTGSALAGQIRTNQDIEAMVDTTDAWIRERTGIRTRQGYRGFFVCKGLQRSIKMC